MKSIVLKQIEFLNFKGLGTAEKGGKLIINFNPDLTTISGRNALGKTSIFDGFTWCLFGKDSHDRKSFNIKTLGIDGKAIERLPHEVKVTLQVDEEEITICRRYEEQWTRKRGTDTEVFTGHEETRLYNDVPCSVKEFAEKITALCSEDVFKYITNPLYFNTQKDEIKRSMLFDMAGNINDDDIAANNPDFLQLLAILQGKSLSDYQKEIGAKKKRIKDEMQTIPARIDEVKRSVPATDDWEALERELNEKTESVKNIDLQLTDISARIGEQDKAVKALYAKKHELEVQSQTLYNELQRKHLADWQSHFSAKNSADIELSRRRNLIETREQEIKYIEAEIKQAEDKLTASRKEYADISAERFVMDEKQTYCPACGRRFEDGDLQARFEEMQALFNTDKARRLSENVNNGRSLVESNNKKKAIVEDIRKEIEKLQNECAEIEQSEAYNWKLVSKPNVEPKIMADEAYIALLSAIDDVDKQIAQSREENAGNSDLLQAKQVLQSNIDELKSRLAAKAQIESAGKRIQELQIEYQNAAQAISDLEKAEFTVANFKRAKVEAVENRINGLFSIVRFKMYDTQINGGEVECCEATVNGVPFSDINDAAKINAGLDIIYAICKCYGVCAPIFIDNAESVNELLQTQSQLIRLVVSNDNQLTIS